MDEIIIPELPLRGVLRLQKKSEDTESYIKSCRPIFRKAIKEQRLQSATVFILDDQIFFYYESKVPFIIEDYLPDIANYVYMWPGKEELRPFVPMIKYYQSVPMEAVDDWTQAGKEHRPKLMVSRMKLDLLQSYIYYHYQLQEERPGHSGRYVAIWGNEEWCVLYDKANTSGKFEFSYNRKLDTNNVPIDKWGKLMPPHFYKWPVSKFYRLAKIILHI